jgi:hypothetical protein
VDVFKNAGAQIFPDMSYARTLDFMQTVEAFARLARMTLFGFGRMTPPDLRKACRQALDAYGPNGDTIKGALKP